MSSNDIPVYVNEFSSMVGNILKNNPALLDMLINYLNEAGKRLCQISDNLTIKSNGDVSQRQFERTAALIVLDKLGYVATPSMLDTLCQHGRGREILDQAVNLKLDSPKQLRSTRIHPMKPSPPTFEEI